MTFEVYQDVAGEWRWRLVAGNGQIVASSNESFTTRQHAARAANNVLLKAGAAKLVSVVQEEKPVGAEE